VHAGIPSYRSVAYVGGFQRYITPKRYINLLAHSLDFYKLLTSLLLLVLAYAMPSLSKTAGATLGALLPFTLAGTPQNCSNNATELSCHGSSTNTCCYNSPGGLFQQVQFWDTNPATGPSSSWTIHGLWPNNCDGTYSEDCDESRAYTNITQLLKAAGQTSVLSYMQTYWVSDDESNEAFWDHEWETHGTCISTLKPSCYTDYTPGEEAVDFFTRVVSLFQTLPTYTVRCLPSTYLHYRTKLKVKCILVARKRRHKPFLIKNLQLVSYEQSPRNRIWRTGYTPLPRQ